MAPTSGTQWFYPARLRSYIFRLPLFTRIVILVIVVFWISELQSFWNVVQWGALIPSEIGFGTSTSSAHCEDAMFVSDRGRAWLGEFVGAKGGADGCAVVVYRLNTYPLIHADFLGFVLALLALMPLMERFEADQGTLLTLAMFFGRTYPKRLFM